jgi:HEPN domain-containing protein
MTQAEAYRMARGHLKDSRVLLRAGRLDGAVYLAGYVIELALKVRICRTHRWPDYPTSGGYSCLKTHDLAVLLAFSGVEPRIKTRYLAEW